jgi:hypothetical protein
VNIDVTLGGSPWKPGHSRRNSCSQVNALDCINGVARNATLPIIEELCRLEKFSQVRPRDLIVVQRRFLGFAHHRDVV